MERVKSAKKVPEAEWEGPVWPDGSGDGFDSVDSMRDYYDAEGEEVPCPVWGTTPLKLRLDATSILEHATEEMYESAFDHVSDDDLRKLQDVLDEWAKEYGPPDGYEEDNSIVVVLEGDTDEPT